MDAPDLVYQLRNSGYSIQIDSNYIDISPAELPSELIQQLKDNKTEILCVLHRENELKRLVLLVSKHNEFSQEDYKEALRYALADQVLALTCFTALARQAGLI